AEARQVHGPEGDDCWQEARCHRRRSHYRNRRDVNAERRSLYRQEVAEKQADNAPDTLTVPIPLKPVAYLYLYRQKRQDAPLHAISISVWQGDQRLSEVTPIHCAGLRNQQIQAYLMEVLGKLRQQYGIIKFEPEVRLDPAECPIANCPLKHRPVEVASE
ncbi:MAG: hypothetical protein F6K42_12320, partial [Leptolyngbya sp. SIO1D8]|nr:hypothetical protein [Leptolyngbya sp. SIO1D8]